MLFTMTEDTAADIPATSNCLH